MTGTVRPIGVAWGIIGDMMRMLGGVAAWLGGTAAAVGLAWFGAGMVVRNTTASPALPAISVTAPASAAPPPAPATAPGPSGPAHPSPTASPTAPATPAPAPTTAPAASRPPAPAPSRRPSPAPSPSGQTRSYTLQGGRVTLLVTAESAQLVTAVPDAGFAVQTWSGTDWLRVDFSSGVQVSSLIDSWNGHSPSVTVTN